MDPLSDADVAALYDVQNPWDPNQSRADAFHHGMVMEARDVLDVGCGTGSMLHVAREAGHAGRLVGLDPDETMLARARRWTDIEWVLGRASDARWRGEFDLAAMASHAFQCLIDDDELRDSLAAICRALRQGGLFAFETRHPQARAWEQWAQAEATEFTMPSGRVVRSWYGVESVIGDVVTLTETFADPGGGAVRVDRAQLRFLDIADLNRFLEEAGFEIQGQYGDWDRGEVSRVSTEIITVARRP